MPPLWFNSRVTDQGPSFPAEHDVEMCCYQRDSRDLNSKDILSANCTGVNQVTFGWYKSRRNVFVRTCPKLNIFNEDLALNLLILELVTFFVLKPNGHGSTTSASYALKQVLCFPGNVIVRYE